MASALAEILRCPVCRGELARDDGSFRCARCAEDYPVEDGIARMLSDKLPGIELKRNEIAGWPELARADGWYTTDDHVDSHLPFVNRDLRWESSDWAGTEVSFQLLLDDWIRPGQRVLEVGAAKCWAAQHLLPRGVEYVATDLLADPVIGLGRGSFFGDFERVQADGERLPFADASFDVTYCVAALHHALDPVRMLRELARVTRPGGVVAALNEGTRPIRWSEDAPQQQHEKQYGINEHVHPLWRYLWSFARAGLVPVRLARADGHWGELGKRKWVRGVFSLPAGELWMTLIAHSLIDYSGLTVFSRKPRFAR